MTDLDGCDHGDECEVCELATELLQARAELEAQRRDIDAGFQSVREQRDQARAALTEIYSRALLSSQFQGLGQREFQAISAIARAALSPVEVPE